MRCLVGLFKNTPVSPYSAHRILIEGQLLMVNQTCIKLFLPDLVDGCQQLGFLAGGHYGRGGCAAAGSQCQQGDRCAGKGEEFASVHLFHGGAPFNTIYDRLRFATCGKSVHLCPASDRCKVYHYRHRIGLALNGGAVEPDHPLLGMRTRQSMPGQTPHKLPDLALSTRIQLL